VLEFISGDVRKLKTDLLIIPVCEDKDLHQNKCLLEIIAKTDNLPEFNGEKKEELILYDPLPIAAKRALLIGLGPYKDLTAESWRKLAGQSVKLAQNKSLNDLLFAVPPARKIKLEMAGVLQALGEGAILGNHIFDHYQNDPQKKPLQNLQCLVSSSSLKTHAKIARQTNIVCQATCQARDWVSIPANDKTPKVLASQIVQQAKEAGLETRVLSEKELQKMGFGALLSVSIGSSNAPQLILLEHHPKAATQSYPLIALVGKGVTFDTGGINLKSGSSLEQMKMDMAGGAAVAATLISAAQQNLPLHIVGAIPVVENMVSGRATRPGDIIKSYSGKTIEIGNTDAEGRLILADTFAYLINKYAPGIMIDLATLTGACMVALGEKIAGLFTTDKSLGSLIYQAGEKSFERCWPMPLPDDYHELLKSEYADIRNIGRSRWGGAIVAALFLSQFTENVRWAHIDIAGPAYSSKASDYCGAGGTGFGVRLLNELFAQMLVEGKG
jgi:leucyl aminopeptidase